MCCHAIHHHLLPPPLATTSAASCWRPPTSSPCCIRYATIHNTTQHKSTRYNMQHNSTQFVPLLDLSPHILPQTTHSHILYHLSCASPPLLVNTSFNTHSLMYGCMAVICNTSCGKRSLRTPRSSCSSSTASTNSCRYNNYNTYGR